MDISTLVNNYQKQNIQSEKEVCSKLLGPLTELLGYSQDVRSEEFPVYGSEGRNDLPTKHADFLLFNDPDFASHRTKAKLDWVYRHSLLVIEAKKPTEKLDNIGQPIFYSAWTRAIAYILCNGIEIQAYLINANFSDSLICSCKIEELPLYWDKLNKLNFSSLEQLKGEAEGKYSSWISTDIYDDYINEIAEQCSEELKSAVDRNLQQINRSLDRTDKSDLSIRQIVDDGQSAVITSEPGGGKSYLLWMLLREFLHSFHEDKKKIPVLLQGRYFCRKWSSIRAGIFQKVHDILPSVTYEMVDQRMRQGDFVILFDGLDEVEENYDILVDDLHQINTDTENILILTCREQNYKDDFNHGFVLCRLLPLTDGQVQRYLNQYTGGGTSIYFHLSANLRELLSNPLYLVMFCAIASKDEGFKVPKNMSSLFERYCSDRLKFLGCDPFRMNQIDSILRKYAFDTYGNSDADSRLFEMLNSKFPGAEAHSVFNTIWKSGLIVKESEGIRFFHKALHEYYYARELSYKNKDEIKKWIKSNADNENYFEIICYLTGIIADRQKQNYVLDFLEGLNLKLYTSALHSRHNFGNTQVEITEEYVHNYFGQLLSTYRNVIERYFYNIPYIFDGYVGRKDGIPSLVGTMDPNEQSIGLQIYCGEKNGDNLRIKLTTGGKAVMSFQDGRSVPIHSSVFTQGSMHLRYYNLGMLSYGFDSSREIALDIIKCQIEEALKGKRFLDFFAMPLQLENDDKYLKDIGAGPDKTFPKGQTSCRFDELYSDRQLVHRVMVVEDTVREVLDQIHERVLPILKTAKQRVRKIGIVYREDDISGVVFMYVKIVDTEDSYPIVEYSNTRPDMRPQETPYFMKQLHEIGKSEKDIFGSGGSAMLLYFQKEVIHEMVYKELSNEFKTLWAGNR
jgi:hypothetical protein